MAVEDASFSTVMSSMSDAGISEMDSTGKPSTINSGVLSPVIEPPPRTRIFISASGDPSVVVICTPAILPVNASVADATVQPLMPQNLLLQQNLLNLSFWLYRIR